MTQVTYQKKLSRHFTRYAAVLVLLLFVAFTLILSVYTIGLNIYRNDRNNSLLSDSFRLTHKEYTGFLEDGNTRDLFQRRLQGDVSEQYLAYQYRQFSRAAHLPGMLILSDEQGDILYVSASTDTLSTHLKYFNKLIHHNLMQTPASYTTVYRFLNEVGKYVIAAPVPDKNGRMIGSAVIYIDDSSWEEIMRLNQFDGIITDESGHIIAASNRNMVENQTFFSDDDRLLYRHQYEELTRQYEDLKVKYEELQDRRKQMNETAIIFGGMLFELWELEEIPVTFKESLWHTLVDYATVYADERIVFHFKDGTEITTML